MRNFEKFYYSTFGLFFEGVKLYYINLNDFNNEENLELIGNFKFYMPTEKELNLFEKLYENLPGRMELIKKRFESGNYLCFAYQDIANNRLAYTRWICTNEFYSDALQKQLIFKPDEALTLDSYTSPVYRLAGLHRNMNILMLQWLKTNTEIRTVFMVILMFISHLTKIPKELGYKPIARTFYYKKNSVSEFIHLLKRKISV
jgi:hypothetical protein